jgi:hypothetical protein
MKNKDLNDDFLKNLFQKTPECCPSDDFVEKVMNACCTVEVKQTFNIFVWLREKQSKLVISMTTGIIHSFDNMLKDYKLVTQIPQPIQQSI